MAVVNFRISPAAIELNCSRSSPAPAVITSPGANFVAGDEDVIARSADERIGLGAAGDGERVAA